MFQILRMKEPKLRCWLQCLPLLNLFKTELQLLKEVPLYLVLQECFTLISLLKLPKTDSHQLSRLTKPQEMLSMLLNRYKAMDSKTNKWDRILLRVMEDKEDLYSISTNNFQEYRSRSDKSSRYNKNFTAKNLIISRQDSIYLKDPRAMSIFIKCLPSIKSLL